MCSKPKKVCIKELQQEFIIDQMMLQHQALKRDDEQTSKCKAGWVWSARFWKEPSRAVRGCVRANRKVFERGRVCKAKEKRGLERERQTKPLTNKQECTSVWHKDLRAFNLL